MPSFEKVSEFYNVFPQQFRSLVLGTVNGGGAPHVSYSPFIIDPAKNIYIYVSGLSEHTTNLIGAGQASVLFIEDESQTEQIFARRRLTYHCQAQALARESEQWQRMAEQFEDRFGEIITVLKGLRDFQIFQLQPQSGRFVVGFGSAYEADPNDLTQLVPLSPPKP